MFYILPQGYCWFENVRGHFAENAPLKSLSRIFLHYTTGPLFQNEGFISKIKGQFCPWPLPKLSLQYTSPVFQGTVVVNVTTME